MGILFDRYSNCVVWLIDNMLVSWDLQKRITDLQTLIDLYMLFSLTFDDDIAI